MQVGAITETSTTSQKYPVVAAGAGTTTLTVTDANGKVLDSEDIEVDKATSYQLCDQGLLMSGASDDRSAVTQIHLLAGGTATFLVRYFAGTKEPRATARSCPRAVPASARAPSRRASRPGTSSR